MTGFEVSTEVSMRQRAMLHVVTEVGRLSAQNVSRRTIGFLVRAGFDARRPALKIR
jgi:hypothetical protein